MAKPTGNHEGELIMLDNIALDTLFRKARTHNVWLDTPVTDEQLHQIYELMKWGPTSANSCPARIVFVKSPQEKEKLVACMDEGNQAKTRKAPVTAIVGMDMQFYDKLPGWMSGLGFQANVTVMTGGLESSTDTYLEGKPFQGMSKYAYNLVGLYEKNGWSGRLAYNWRSRYTDTYNAGTINGAPYDLVVAPISALDASLSYEVAKNFTVVLEGNNLLNFEYHDYFSNSSITPRDTRYYDRTLRIGVRWKL